MDVGDDCAGVSNPSAAFYPGFPTDGTNSQPLRRIVTDNPRAILRAVNQVKLLY